MKYIDNLLVDLVGQTSKTTHTSLLPIRCEFAPDFVNYKKGALDSQLQVISLPVACPWSMLLSGYSGFFYN